MAKTSIDDRTRGTMQLRVLNTRRVLGAVREMGRPARIAELTTRTSLTRPTVTQIVSTLETRGYLQRYGPTETSGRPAVRYGLAETAFAVLGADVGAHRTVVEIASLNGETRSRREHRRTQALGEGMLELLSEMVRECLDEIGSAPDAVIAGTVASPGIVERPSGKITLRPGLGSWTGDQVSAALGRSVGGAIAVENDANLAARAMCTLPDMPPTFLGLQWGQRLGAGIVLDGQVYRGRFGAAGELGSLLVTDPVGGGTMNLESVVRASRLPIVGGVPRTTTEALAEAAEAGDFLSVQALRRAVDPLAASVAPLCVGLDLQTVTVSGAIARSGPALGEALRERLAAHGAVDVDCRLSPFLEDTVLRGAVSDAADAGWARLLDEGGTRTSAAAGEPGGGSGISPR